MTAKPQCACHVSVSARSLADRVAAERLRAQVALCPLHKAAPKLLAALQAILGHVENTQAAWPLRDAARAAIEEATK